MPTLNGRNRWGRECDDSPKWQIGRAFVRRSDGYFETYYDARNGQRVGGLRYVNDHALPTRRRTDLNHPR